MQSSTCNLRLRTSIVLLAGILSLSLASTATFAQDTTPPQTPATDNPETDRTHLTSAQNTQEAWQMITTAVQDPKHPDLRTQALAALGSLGDNARGERLILDAMKDPDVDVRTAAVLAAGLTKSRNLTTDLRNMLDDKEPQVAFAAAITLWKMNDRSGEDILLAVVNGDRKATAGLRDSAMHKVGKELHNPASLARFGALQGASILLGPFGVGISAYEYMRKNGGDSARVSAIEQISQQMTNPIRAQLVDALDDKDPAVRAAAAQALGSYRDKVVSDALLTIFDDVKPPVRLTAAAAYIRSTEPAPKVRATPRKH